MTALATAAYRSSALSQIDTIWLPKEPELQSALRDLKDHAGILTERVFYTTAAKLQNDVMAHTVLVPGFEDATYRVMASLAENAGAPWAAQQPLRVRVISPRIDKNLIDNLSSSAELSFINALPVDNDHRFSTIIRDHHLPAVVSDLMQDIDTGLALIAEPCAEAERIESEKQHYLLQDQILSEKELAAHRENATMLRALMQASADSYGSMAAQTSIIALLGSIKRYITAVDSYLMPSKDDAQAVRVSAIEMEAFLKAAIADPTLSFETRMMLQSKFEQIQQNRMDGASLSRESVIVSALQAEAKAAPDARASAGISSVSVTPVQLTLASSQFFEAAASTVSQSAGNLQLVHSVPTALVAGPEAKATIAALTSNLPVANAAGNNTVSSAPIAPAALPIMASVGVINPNAALPVQNNAQPNAQAVAAEAQVRQYTFAHADKSATTRLSRSQENSGSLIFSSTSSSDSSASRASPSFLADRSSPREAKDSIASVWGTREPTQTFSNERFFDRPEQVVKTTGLSRAEIVGFSKTPDVTARVQPLSFFERSVGTVKETIKKAFKAAASGMCANCTNGGNCATCTRGHITAEKDAAIRAALKLS